MNLLVVDNWGKNLVDAFVNWCVYTLHHGSLKVLTLYITVVSNFCNRSCNCLIIISLSSISICILWYVTSHLSFSGTCKGSGSNEPLPLVTLANVEATAAKWADWRSQIPWMTSSQFDQTFAGTAAKRETSPSIARRPWISSPLGISQLPHSVRNQSVRF